jgi:hypothetical protein
LEPVVIACLYGKVGGANLQVKWRPGPLLAACLQRISAALITFDAFRVATDTEVFGNARRNALRDQVTSPLTSVAFKVTTLREKLKLEFKFDAFNILNHPVLATPNSPTQDRLSSQHLFALTGKDHCCGRFVQDFLPKNVRREVACNPSL